jgi:hypothetical protein
MAGGLGATGAAAIIAADLDAADCHECEEKSPVRDSRRGERSGRVSNLESPPVPDSEELCPFVSPLLTSGAGRVETLVARSSLMKSKMTSPSVAARAANRTSLFIRVLIFRRFYFSSLSGR